MTRKMALMALTALGLSCEPFHDLFYDALQRVRAYVTGAVGFACIALALFFVVRVLVPQITDSDDLITGKRPFKKLKRRFQRNDGTLLPLRVRTFAELGGRTRFGAQTLDELERSINASDGQSRREKEFQTYCDAQVGRTKWLSYLMQTATQWTVIASYQAVKA